MVDLSIRIFLMIVQLLMLGVVSEIDDIFVVLDMFENYIIGYDVVFLMVKSFKGISDILLGLYFFWWIFFNGVGVRFGLWIVSLLEVQRVYVM